MKTIALLLILLSVPALCFAGSVTLQWNGVDEATGYKIYYGIETGKYTATVDAGNVTGLTIPNLKAGVKYYFVATAYNDLIESAYSNEASGVIPLNAPDELVIIVRTSK